MLTRMTQILKLTIPNVGKYVEQLECLVNGNTKHEEVTSGNSSVSSYEIILYLPHSSPILPLWELIQER